MLGEMEDTVQLLVDHFTQHDVSLNIIANCKNAIYNQTFDLREGNIDYELLQFISSP